jgi:SAM-dependent methyltransferase
MDWNDIDWTALERLRGAFLSGTAGAKDYWQSERDLAAYDQTFAQRIGWKWDYVLGELGRRGWTPPAGDVLDWGCGSGLAGRAFLDHFGTGTRSLLLWDRSALAVQFAGRRAQERFSDLVVRPADPDRVSFGILLLSHVLTELTERQLEALLDPLTRATAVIWIEPGTHEVSRRLIRLREPLRTSFQVVAPCPHQGTCGLLVPANAPHWCHHFASPPPEVFTDGNWVRFAQLTGIDLRSLPLSFLVLDKRPAPPLPTGTVRVIGRPRVYKAHALLLGCELSGVHERRITRRDLPEAFRTIKKGETPALQVWDCSQDRIVRVRETEETKL